ncbi:uncharacterized protein F4807DRAFT_165671 [Annulohypoxylon truncatum]|uniref:uncharacterized protein n=1 Tax=Annulohypoxylon truncatum TaxID=327061 RepID=UPI00200897BF|nr:uncharacterized protein F4807DRAFT_165671 [Annulohypoxylon truncatum]KAI1207751.1 hypothetical protein F4807DRAFT_165671 [Annulohypoxylon truncatum]
MTETSYCSTQIQRMKATPQKPGPNGSRVVKRKSTPRLGDGLCEVLNGVSCSHATDKKPVIATTANVQFHDRNNSTPTATSGTPPDTNVTTPVSFTGSLNVDQSHGAKELEASTFDESASHNMSTFIPQHYGLSSATFTQTCPLLYPATSTNYYHDDWPSSISPVASPTYPIYTTPAHILSARILQESRFHRDLALNKIIQWFLDGTLSLSETKETAKKYGYWDFLGALEALHATTTPDASQDNVSQAQEFPTPFATNQPAGHSTSHTSNAVPPGTHSAYIDAAEAARRHFRQKVMKHVDIDKLFDPSNESKLHLFVDISNIFIGFCDAIKASRRIPQGHKIPAPVFSFKTLAVLMERGRAVQKRILAGSIPGYSASNPRKYWPPYFSEAEELRYQMNIFCRVQTRKLSHSKRRGRKSPKATSHDVNDLSTGESTGDDGLVMAYEVRNGEQGVDENLHLNMMNSMWDHISCPGTIVLATGDAAEAEFSHGFLHYATRALEKGWRLELVTWKHSISSAWTNPKFSGKYSSQFRIIYLDDFLEELQTKTDGYSV